MPTRRLAHARHVLPAGEEQRRDAVRDVAAHADRAALTPPMKLMRQ